MKFDYGQVYWTLKRFFPGDPEFSLENFYRLPYEYVITAYWRVGRQRMEELHAMEQPLALQSSLFANANRDPKARKKPFTPADFYCYLPADQQDKPSARYAAAYQKLLQDKELPAWALFVYTSLRNEEGAIAPTPHVLRADGIILLAPTWGDGTIEGMLIATEREEGYVELVGPEGDRYTVRMPAMPTKVQALEEFEVKLLQ